MKFAVGTSVVVTEPMKVPELSQCDNDGGKTSSFVKKRLQSKFFAGSDHIRAEIIYEPQEGELRRKGLMKVKVSEACGNSVNLTAPIGCLKISGRTKIAAKFL